jgi:tetraacyldisaccharide 4'-kinase
MRLLRLLLFPVSFFYGLAVIIRNWAYDQGILKSRRFKIPIISVGNLAVGGAGKSPMTEYLVRLLKDDFKLATLSRGYGRRTEGFFKVKPSSIADDVGDEPLQFKRKFPDITVAVCEDRVEGVKELNQHHEVIILDDAYQHRALRAGLSILLFDYSSLNHFQWLLPSGDLREPLNERKRANIIVISKAPIDLTTEDRQKALAKVRPFPQQELFFSSIQYANLKMLLHPEQELRLEQIRPETEILLLTGIANPAPLVEQLKLFSSRINHHHYGDHHQFSKKNITKLVKSFRELSSPEKLIITTEKDAQRLASPQFHELFRTLPVYYLPVEAIIHQQEAQRFNDLIKEYVRKNSVNHRVHKA